MAAAITLADITGLVIAFTGLLGAVAAIIAAVHAGRIRRDIKLPSNGLKMGQLVEGMAQVQHWLTDLQTGQTSIPSATEVGRALANGTTVPQPTQTSERREAVTPPAVPPVPGR